MASGSFWFRRSGVATSAFPETTVRPTREPLFTFVPAATSWSVIVPSGWSLLFTNAFSAYATAAALISQGSPLITLQIANQFQSEVVLGQENVGKAIALGMIVIVSIVMAVYALIQRRASRWVR